jgi:hypothetical protein
MKKKLVVVAFALAALMLMNVGSVFAAGGFDQYGYNYKASLFNGTVWGWALKLGADNGWTQQQTLDWLNGWYGAGTQTIAFYQEQKLVMNWNKEWDRGNAEGWTGAYYAAWTTNMYNGVNPDGTHYTWHYKIIWVGPLLGSSPYWREGGYSIWGNFEVIMDQGTSAGVHSVYALTAPNGLGGIKA